MLSFGRRKTVLVISRSFSAHFLRSRIVDKKEMIRNRYNRIPCPKHQTGKGHLNFDGTNGNFDGTKIKTAQEKSQEDSSFPTDGHKAILNKLNSKSKTNRKRTNIDN